MKRSLVLLLVLALAVSLAGCGTPAAPAEEPDEGEEPVSTEPIRIGYLAHITGDGAVWGVAESNGAKMAVEDINAAGGVLGRQLELFVADGRGNAADSVNATRRLVEQDKVIAVLGSNYSGVNIATAPIVAAAKVPQIGSFSTNPLVTVDENGNVRPWSFRLCFIDPYQGKVIADFAYNELGLKNAAVLYDIGSDYSVGLTEYFKARFEELGGTVIGTWAFKAGDVDFRPQLSEIKAKGPELLVLPNLYKEIALPAKQARELGMSDLVFMGGDGYSLTMLEMAGPELEGSYWTGHMTWKDPEIAPMKDRYTAKYGVEDPEYNLVMGYDIVYFLVDAIKRAGSTDGEALRNAIETAKDVQLKHAVITMDPETHNPLNKPAVIEKVEGSKFVFHSKYVPE
ncbi:MAG: ABC transporter substrate-binding protein [Bacillota bacterium]